MIHFVYKTYNPDNQKFYIGRHSTNNIDDGYQGSGLWIKRSINKGHVLKREILEYADNINELYLLEEKYIRKYYNNPKNTNCKLSSTGMTSEDVSGKNNPRYGSKEQAEIARKIGLANKGKKRSAEYCKRQSEKYKGKGNPMYGVKRNGAENPNYKGGIFLNNPNYYRDWARRKRAEKKAQK